MVQDCATDSLEKQSSGFEFRVFPSLRSVALPKVGTKIFSSCLPIAVCIYIYIYILVYVGNIFTRARLKRINLLAERSEGRDHGVLKSEVSLGQTSHNKWTHAVFDWYPKEMKFGRPHRWLEDKILKCFGLI